MVLSYALTCAAFWQFKLSGIEVMHIILVVIIVMPVIIVITILIMPIIVMVVDIPPVKINHE